MSNQPLLKEIKSDEFGDRYDQKKLFRGIPQHSKLVIALTVLFSLLGLYQTYHYLSGKQANAILVYQADDTKTLPGGIPLTTPTLATTLDLIKVPSNLQAVRTMLGLDMSIKALDAAYEIPYPKVDSNMIKIVARGKDPVELANALAKVAVKSSQDYYREQLKQALFNYKDQLDFALQAQSKQLQEIESFKKDNQYYDVDDRTSLFLNRLQDIRKRSQEANLLYNNLMVEYDNLKREAKKYSASSSESGDSPANIRDRLNQLQPILFDARIRLAPQNPRLLSLEKEYARLKEELNKGSGGDGTQISAPAREKIELDMLALQGKVRSAQKNRQEIAEELEGMEGEIENFPKLQVAFQKLMQDKKLIDDQVAFLNGAIDKTELLLNSPRGSLALYQLADKDDVLKDSWWVKLLPFIGAIFGFSLGILAALGLEMRDTHFRTLKQFSLRYNTIKPLLLIPELKKLVPSNSYESILFFLRDLVDRLDPLLLQKGLSRSKYTLSIISSQNGEGKTLIGYNLAKYYKSQNLKVCFIEFDPNPSSLLDNAYAHTPNLISVLKGKSTFEEALVPGDVDVITVGKGDLHLKELAKSGPMISLINKLKNSYDIVIIDTPGLIENDAATSLALLTDVNVFIVGSSLTDRTAVDSSLNDLIERHIVPYGIILNQVPPIYVEDERVLAELKRMKDRVKGSFLKWS